MDPLSITTGIITLYSAIWQLKKIKDAHIEVPEIISLLEADCDNTLSIILHTKSRLDNHDRHPTPDDVFNPINIREKLRANIACLHPEVKYLQAELTTLLQSPDTNYDYLKSLLAKQRHVTHLKSVHKKIAGRLEHFDRLLRALDGETADWIRRNSWRNSTLLSPTISPRLCDWCPSSEGTGSGESDDGIPCAPKLVRSEEGTKILLQAITSGRRMDVKMIILVLAVDPNFMDAKTGMYPLHVATVRDDVVMMEQLLKCHANPGVRNRQGQTALHIAVGKDMEKAVQLLLRNNAYPNTEDKKGRTPLWHAACHGKSPKTFQILTELDSQGIDIINHHCSDLEKPTALWAAAAAPCLPTAQTLIEAGASTRVLDRQGSTLLHKADWPIASAIAPLLLANGADFWAKDKEGKLPLHRAAAAGKTGIVEALLERMGNGGVDERDGNGATALILGAQKGWLPMVWVLVEKWQAKCSVRDRTGNGAFYYACEFGHVLVATYLLGRGADINEGNEKGNTPLHAAARAGHREIVLLLLQLGADKLARSSQMAPGASGPATPAKFASGAGYRDIANMIETFKLDDEPVAWRVEIQPNPTGS